MPVERARVIGDFLLGKLQPVGRRYHYYPLMAANHLTVDQFSQRRQSDAGVRTVEHARAVGARAASASSDSEACSTMP